MNLKFLGASGGLGGNVSANNGSTCVQVADDILIDVGTGVTALNLQQMQKVRHVFLTHSHSDHICCLPMLLGNLFNVASTEQPVTVYGSHDTLEAIREHVFNWVVWPDMRELPSKEKPLLRLQEIEAGEVFQFGDITLEPFKTYHTVPTLGFAVRRTGRQTVFVADSGYAQSVVVNLNALGPIDDIILECSFPNELEDVANQSCHLTPALCDKLLSELAVQPRNIWINHLKPDVEQQIIPQLPSAWKLL
ncbi:3',5'-cyclic-nucleotide phosphodiesterase [Pseudidiomarina woesei]|uniref:Ribonuclease BN, tRNA processing enzyme n=1 Tax=Pseudidiomarina woesei TaxID=1381080 RepID=A0A0K6H6X0_9GAMM|nr:3',5'-cyclic-nucleotide phosphodiesterase [Pseudidiomarina woesei]CUA86732.1 Ribonuclease BN, tRNA processing enzyme [Pseudidiomarina woesei]